MLCVENMPYLMSKRAPCLGGAVRGQSDRPGAEPLVNLAFTTDQIAEVGVAIGKAHIAVAACGPGVGDDAAS